MSAVIVERVLRVGKATALLPLTRSKSFCGRA
jgi:hypothetical protein